MKMSPIRDNIPVRFGRFNGASFEANKIYLGLYVLLYFFQFKQ